MISIDLTALRNSIKLELTGGVLHLEINDSNLDQIITDSLYEIQRYFTGVKLITIPYKNCIELNKVKDPLTKKKIKVNSVVKLYRPTAMGISANKDRYSSDPWQMMWNVYGGGMGNLRPLNDFSQNYLAYSAMSQLRNTLSTDLAFKHDKSSNKLYINLSSGVPENITLEYIPRLETVSDVESDFWIDKLKKLALARTKIALGHVRTKYSQTNALWANDGDKMLEEGTNELNAVREELKNADVFIYPVD